jgi:zinc transporter ZupT
VRRPPRAQLSCTTRPGRPVLEPAVLTVAVAGLITALATGLGALPLLAGREVGTNTLGLANAVAAGLMLAASHSLIAEGNLIGILRTVAGMALGVIVVSAGQRWIEAQGDVSVGDLRGADARRAILIIGVMTLHSFAEGIGVGVSFAGEGQLGAFITAAIAVHNIPEGLAIALVMVPRGTPVWKAAGWAVVSSLPQPLMAVPAYLFVTAFEPLLPVGLGLAAGAMIWMVLAELMPEATEQTGADRAAIAAVLALAAMIAFQGLVLPDA